MVNNLPLFPYQAYLSPIQTDWPARSSAICGQNCKVTSLQTNNKMAFVPFATFWRSASLPASFQATSTYFGFRNRLCKGVPQRRIRLLTRLNG